MKKAINKVLHLTPHLGGGVGKALCGMISESIKTDSAFHHDIICLEKPEQTQFVEKLRECRASIHIGFDKRQSKELIRDADIVQLEWWNHPVTFKVLTELTDIPMRLLTWCHVSGLSTPVIPEGLLKYSHRFIFTSPCTYQATVVRKVVEEFGGRLGVVSSSGGFDGFPHPDSGNNPKEELSVGYIGSLNFSKLHPQYITYLNQVSLPGFSVTMIGEPNNQSVLTEQMRKIGKPHLLEFTGYTTDVVNELKSINVLAYLLNPDHYGTTENALIEAMSMGIVPVVLDNPAERNIITHGENGFIVHTPSEFAQVIDWLANNPAERHAIGIRASNSVRERFSVYKSCKEMDEYYQQVARLNKETIPFQEILGKKPSDWFLLCQEDKNRFAQNYSPFDSTKSTLFNMDYEQTKGSILHFSRYFPEDKRLGEWADIARWKS